MRYFKIAICTAALSACSQGGSGTPQPPSSTEIEAAVVYQVGRNGTLQALDIGDCNYSPEYENYLCRVSYTYSSSYNGRTVRDEGQLCMTLMAGASDARSAYDIEGTNTLPY